MAKKFLNDIDMDQNEILNMRVQNLSSAPSNPKEGQLYYNSIDKLTYQYNGTSWIPLLVTNSDVPVGVLYPFGGSVAPTNYLICDGSAISRTEYSELFNVIGTSYGEGDGETTFNLPNLKGKVPVGLDSNDSDFNTLGNEYGEKTHQLTIDEIASHTHTFTGTEHTHTFTGTEHSHTYAKPNSSTGQASGNTGSTTLTIDQIPSHDHEEFATANPNTGGIGIRGTFNGNEGKGQSGYDTGMKTGKTGGGQGHTHTLNSHTHTISTTNTTIKATAGGTNSKTTAGGTNSNTGGGLAHNNVQPSVVTNYIIKAKSANSNSMLRKVYNACDLTLTFSETGEVTPQEFVNAWFGDETHTVSDLKPIIEDIFYNNAILMMGTQPIVCPCATDFRGTSSSAPFGVATLRFGWFQPTENMIHYLYFTFNATRNRLAICRDWDLTYSNSLDIDNDHRALSLAGAKALKDLIDGLQSQIDALATKVDTQELDINGTKVLYDDGN